MVLTKVNNKSQFFGYFIHLKSTTNLAFLENRHLWKNHLVERKSYRALENQHSRSVWVQLSHKWSKKSKHCAPTSLFGIDHFETRSFHIQTGFQKKKFRPFSFSRSFVFFFESGYGFDIKWKTRESHEFCYSGKLIYLWWTKDFYMLYEGCIRPVLGGKSCLKRHI